jgi:septal ring factor EnvC (AmiA/AmiB activator)
MSDEENKTAQVEFAGMSLSGSKLLLLIPILSALGGALWGGFEVYQRLLDAEEAITSYIAPDMSGIEQQLAVQQTQMNEFKATIEQQFTTTNQLLTEQRTQINDIRQSMRDQEDLVRAIDANTATTQRELRNDVYEMEKELNDRVKELDTTLRTVREDLEKKMQEILANPLNTVE